MVPCKSSLCVDLLYARYFAVARSTFNGRRLGATVLSYHFPCRPFLCLQCSEGPLCKHEQLGNHHPARVESYMAGRSCMSNLREVLWCKPAALGNDPTGVGPVDVVRATIEGETAAIWTVSDSTVTTKITNYRKNSTEITEPKSQMPCDEIT